nr:hypothetical protein CFP56_72560 [Quercus suber]
MLFSHAACLMALSALVSAAPAEKRWDGIGSHWSSTKALSSSYLDFGKRFPGRSFSAPSCDMSRAELPSSKPSIPSSFVPTSPDQICSIASPPLPAPAAGLKLFHVAVGRGTQNYTCDTSDSAAVPAAVGAVATLFNSSCMAANQPVLTKTLPAIAVDLPVPASADSASPIYQDVSGHHYFTDNTTPYFNLDTSLHNYGAAAFKKTAASPAPPLSPSGAFGIGYGAVAWLLLDLKDPSTDHPFKQVYRVNTAGGQPPATCAGRPASFEIQYAAEYWFYG